MRVSHKFIGEKSNGKKIKGIKNETLKFSRSNLNISKNIMFAIFLSPIEDIDMKRTIDFEFLYYFPLGGNLLKGKETVLIFMKAFSSPQNMTFWYAKYSIFTKLFHFSTVFSIHSLSDDSRIKIERIRTKIKMKWSWHILPMTSFIAMKLLQIIYSPFKWVYWSQYV